MGPQTVWVLFLPRAWCDREESGLGATFWGNGGEVGENPCRLMSEGKFGSRPECDECGFPIEGIGRQIAGDGVRIHGSNLFDLLIECS